MVVLRVLAIAVVSDRVGYMFLINDQLTDWKISGLAAKSTAKAVGIVQQWIIDTQPNIVVTEKISSAKRKGEHSKSIIAAIAAIAAHNYLLDVSVPRIQNYANKYEEAEALAKQYPELKPWLPKKRRFFDSEPRTTVLFEALALALAVTKKSVALKTLA